MIALVETADELDMRRDRDRERQAERDREIQNNLNVFDLSSWKDRAVIYWERKGLGEKTSKLILRR